jgi:hypothetical protein
MSQQPIDAPAKAAPALAHQAALRYRTSIGDRPQRPESDYATLRAAARTPTPEQGAACDDTIASLIELAEPGIAIANEVPLNQAIVRFGADRSDEAGNALTRRTIDLVQQDGTCFAGGASRRGQWVMRLSVVGWSTTDEDGERSAEAILDACRRAQAEAAA